MQMRRKNRKWVALGVALYLFLIWSAFRWSIRQRPVDGPILEHIEREEVRKLNQQRTREASEQAQANLHPPTGEARLTAAGPAFVAARYDRNHVAFIIATDSESRFPANPRISSGTFTKIAAPAQPAAPLAGLAELWEPDSQSLHFFPRIVQQTKPGDQWTINLAIDSTIPVTIERPVIAPVGCSLGLGFLASISPDRQAVFDAIGKREYFVVRPAPVESASPPVTSHIAELPDWHPPAAVAQQIERQLTERMKQELAAIDARLQANAANPSAARTVPLGNARPRPKEWIHADQGLLGGEGTLDYDVRAYRITPDAFSRLFVRARWKLANATAFLMTAWFRADPQPALLFADSSWSTALREGQADANLGDSLDFQSVLNEFDADRDGWAELLLYSNRGNATDISLALYTDVGLVPLKANLHRDTQSPQSCLDP